MIKEIRYKKVDLKKIDRWVDQETGETLKSELGLNDGFKLQVLVPIKTPYFKVRSSNYVRINLNSLRSIIHKISHNELAILVLMSINLDYGSNVCRTIHKDYANTKWFSQYFGLTTQQFRNIVRKLESIGLVKNVYLPYLKTRQKLYVVNPSIISRGKDIDSEIIDLFDLDEMINYEKKEHFIMLDLDALMIQIHKGLKRHELGIFMVLTTFLSRSYNSLNLSGVELTVALEFLMKSIKRQSIRLNLKELIGRYILIELKKEGTKQVSYYLNPTFVKRGDKFPLPIRHLCVDLRNY